MAMIRTLAGSQPVPKVLVEEQDVADIIDGMQVKHAECTEQYDALVKYFEQDDIYSICHDLWKFCKDNLPYVEEDIKKQHVSAPITILKRSHSDCKCYALFIGGILDALERKGYDLDWQYRYVPTNLFSLEIGHVFVVVTQIDGEPKNLWIDPVLSSFDQHFFYLVKRDEKVSGRSGKALGKVAGFSVLSVPGKSRGGRIGSAASSYYFTQNGQVYAYDGSVRPNGLTADEMGLPYAMELLNKGNPGYDGRHPGTADAWWENPPVTFWLNGFPYALPPPVTDIGGPVPLMPLGLEVRYAPSFGGFTIPNGFMAPVVVAGNGAGYQNKLRLSPDISPIASQLSSYDSLPLILLEAGVGPLINSFSAYPYANNFTSTNNIDGKMFNHRNADDLLQPSISSTVLQTVAPELEVVAQGLNFVVPGLGVAAGAAIKAGAGTSGGGTTSTVTTDAMGNPVAPLPTGLFTNADGSTNYLPWIVVGGVVFYLMTDKKAGNG
jgi:hypothetical protein